MMINLYEKFNQLDKTKVDNQRPVSLSGAIKAYYGVSSDGLFRISFLSTRNTGIEGETKSIDVVQGKSGENSYWTCFDLKNDDLLSVFCCFGEDMISCIERDVSEISAASKLRYRYKTWLALFKKSRSPLSEENAKGLFGELYFLKAYMLSKYGEVKAIMGWSGPDKLSKDFAVDETWYEIKTINSSSAVVKISSLQQLSSEQEGSLVVVKVEEMAPTYESQDSSINQLIQGILPGIQNNEIKDAFLQKIESYGYDFADEMGDKKFAVKKVERYVVNESFPVLREKDINSNAINNVSYQLILRMIQEWSRSL